MSKQLKTIINESLADDFAKFAASTGNRGKVTTSAEVKQKTAEVMAKRAEAAKNAPKKEPVMVDPKYPLGGRDPASGRSYSEEVENPYEINEISAELAKSYLDKSKAAGVKDLDQVSRRFTGSMRAHGAIHRDELKKMGDRLAQQRKDLGLQKEVNEAKATYCGRCGTTHVAPKFGGTCPALKEGVQSVVHKFLAKRASKKADDAFDAGDEEDFKKHMDKSEYHRVKAGGKPTRINTDPDAKFLTKEQAEPVSEERKGLYYYVNKRKAAGTSRPANHPDAPSAQDWKNAAKTAKNESTDMKTLSQIITEAAAKIHPDAIHVKPVKVNGQQKYHVQAVGANHAEHIKVGEHLSDSELDDFSEMGGKIKNVK